MAPFLDLSNFRLTHYGKKSISGPIHDKHLKHECSVFSFRRLARSAGKVLTSYPFNIVYKHNVSRFQYFPAFINKRLNSINGTSRKSEVGRYIINKIATGDLLLVKLDSGSTKKLYNMYYLGNNKFRQRCAIFWWVQHMYFKLCSSTFLRRIFIHQLQFSYIGALGAVRLPFPA